MNKVKFKPITAKNIIRFVEELNERVKKEDLVGMYGTPLYWFQYRVEPEQIVVYDNMGQLDMFDEHDLVRPIIDEMCEKRGWYAEPVSCCCDFTFGEA